MELPSTAAGQGKRDSTVRSGEDLAKLLAAERVHLGDARRSLPTF
jgi:hypothetical protein